MVSPADVAPGVGDEVLCGDEEEDCSPLEAFSTPSSLLLALPLLLALISAEAEAGGEVLPAKRI